MGLSYLLSRGAGWDTVQAWQDTLSGGERQRLALARLLFHRPAFAVLDECTSAVSGCTRCRCPRARAAPHTVPSVLPQRSVLCPVVFVQPPSPPPALPQVSVDGEVQLYEACAHAGITLLSIAHRPTLKRFHQKVVHFDGNVSGSSKGWW